MAASFTQLLEMQLRMKTVVPRYWLANQLFSLGGYGERLRAFKGCHAGKPMLVIGNGPSLNRTPLERFSGVAAIGMNKINLLFPRTTWRPDYIISCNNLVIEQNREFFEQWNSPVFIAHKARNYLNWRKNPSVFLYNIQVSDSFSADFSAGTGRSSSVAYPALQLAYYMGADPVIIFGIDHRFTFDGPARPAIDRLRGDDPNHFDPGYFKDQKWGLPNLENDRRLFRAVREAFEADGRRVVDGTIDGALTVFPKVGLDRALQLAGCSVIGG